MPGLVVPQSSSMAPMVVGPSTKSATRPSHKLPQYLQDEAQKTVREPFDARKHLAFKAPENIIKMEDIGLAGHGISPNAVSDPFSLFTADAIEQIRAEVFSEEVLQECQYASAFNKNMIRGMGPVRAPFTYSAWNSPELIQMISSVAGVDLIPSIDYEIANINISIETGSDPSADGKATAQEEPLGDGLSAMAWHYDSFPFVCVVMLSDCRDMVGGETALRTPSGAIMKVRGPAMGTAVVLQGRYIEHQALKAMGGKERISMVTCFRPKSPFMRDETVLTGVRGISQRPELYSQYTSYRLQILHERIQAQMREERNRQAACRGFNTQTTRDWLMEQLAFIEATVCELIDE